jgi:hypothetical protein
MEVVELAITFCTFAKVTNAVADGRSATEASGQVGRRPGETKKLRA